MAAKPISDCQAGRGTVDRLAAVAIVAVLSRYSPAEASMSLQMRWVGESDLDRVAETRVLCYMHNRQELAEVRKYIHNQGRSVPGDYLLAERDGEAIGTATSLRLTMWVRGSPVSAQGVAHVGTIKTERRRGGVASEVMKGTLRIGREREHVISALMPSRA